MPCVCLLEQVDILQNECLAKDKALKKEQLAHRWAVGNQTHACETDRGIRKESLFPTENPTKSSFFRNSSRRSLLRVRPANVEEIGGLYIPRGSSLGSNRLVVRPPSRAPLPAHDYSTLLTVPLARDTYTVLIVSAHDVRCRSSQAQRDTLRSEADAASLQYKGKQQGESTNVSRSSSYLTEPRNDRWYNEVGILS